MLDLCFYVAFDEQSFGYSIGWYHCSQQLTVDNDNAGAAIRPIHK